MSAAMMPGKMFLFLRHGFEHRDQTLDDYSEAFMFSLYMYKMTV